MLQSSPANSIDIIRPFADSIRGSQDIQLMGGVGTSALADPRTIIDAEQKYVIAPADFYLPVTRPDGNRRDVDVLVKTTDPTRISEVREAVTLAVEPHLEASVFGIRPEQALQRQTRHPFGFAERHAGAIVNNT
jgi:hypothetical protein